MEHRHASLFRVVFTPSCLVLFLYCARVRSAPVTPSVVDVMKNDTRLCATARFLYDSEYVKPCGVTAYPTASITYSLETLNNFLCLGVYDTAYKICQYSSQLQTPLNSTFDSYVRSIVDKYTPNDNKAQEDFCKGLQGFRSQYEKVDSLLKQLVRSLNTPHACEKVCFDLDDKFRPLCAVLAWIKNNDDAMSAKRTETKYDPAALDKPFVNHDEMTSNEKTTLTESKKIEKLTESKKIEKEEKEPKEQNEKQVIIDSNNDNVKEGDSNVPGNAPIAENVKFDEEKIKSDTDKANNSQKKINNTLEKPVQKSVSSIFKENRENTDTELDTNAAIEKSIKDIPPSDDSQGVSINKPINNINKNVVNEGIADKSNKEQSITDSKPSTLSENTQDHYDAENPEENMENDIDDVGDTIQHPDAGNHNENVQEAFERKNNNARLAEYSMRTEDDSHFFTYFTVITLACLAGYIGYHNKQKILAIVLEGRRSRNNRGRRRPSTASYRKLDCTLEEAVTSQCSANVTHVIY